MTARTTLLTIAATLVVAVAAHLLTVWYLPNLIMDRAMAQMGAVNTIHHGQRATPAIHGVVRPSPDLLYSVCPYDLSKGAMKVSAVVPPGTYWSVSAFDDETNNFYVLNDREVESGRIARRGVVRLILLPPGTFSENEGVTSVGTRPIFSNQGDFIYAPSMRGLIVFRTLINDESKFAQIDAVRRQANCKLY